MGRTFMVRTFARWARKHRIPEGVLCAAVEEIRNGLIDADLGAGVIKKRIPVGERGKRGGGRTILASAIGTHVYFMLGFLKNDRQDLTPEELIIYKRLAIELLVHRSADIDRQLANKELLEICHGC